jgi:hypothetical protein
MRLGTLLFIIVISFTSSVGTAYLLKNMFTYLP